MVGEGGGGGGGNKYCHYVKEEQYLNLTVYLKGYEENYLNDDY